MRAVLLFVTLLSSGFAGGVRPENRFDWVPARAAEEARDDIDRGALKIYYAGPDASPVGIPPQLLGLVENIAPGETGSTDTIADEEEAAFRAKQERYAIIYNREIVRHLLVSAKRDPAELEKALADKKGQEEAVRALLEQLERRRKKPNQPPQRNAGSRPISNGSSASETPSSLGPRG